MDEDVVGLITPGNVVAATDEGAAPRGGVGAEGGDGGAVLGRLVEAGQAEHLHVERAVALAAAAGDDEGPVEVGRVRRVPGAGGDGVAGLGQVEAMLDVPCISPCSPTTPPEGGEGRGTGDDHGGAVAALGTGAPEAADDEAAVVEAGDGVAAEAAAGGEAAEVVGAQPDVVVRVEDPNGRGADLAIPAPHKVLTRHDEAILEV